MPGVALRKLILTFLLLTVWAAGSSLVFHSGLWHGQAGTALAALDCCRFTPLNRNEDKFSSRLLPRVHSGEAPCCDPPRRTPYRLTVHQRPESPLPQNPGQPLVFPAGRPHRLYAVGDNGFSPRPGPSGHPALAYLETVVLLN